MPLPPWLGTRAVDVARRRARASLLSCRAGATAAAVRCDGANVARLRAGIAASRSRAVVATPPARRHLGVSSDVALDARERRAASAIGVARASPRRARRRCDHPAPLSRAPRSTACQPLPLTGARPRRARARRRRASRQRALARAGAVWRAASHSITTLRRGKRGRAARARRSPCLSRARGRSAAFCDACGATRARARALADAEARRRRRARLLRRRSRCARRAPRRSEAFAAAAAPRACVRSSLRAAVGVEPSTDAGPSAVRRSRRAPRSAALPAGPATLDR